MLNTTRLARSIRALVTQGLNVLSTLALALAPLIMSAPPAYAATWTSSSLTLSDPRPGNAGGGAGTAVEYDHKFSGATATTIKCIKWVFTVNADGTGGVPTGMTTTVATLDSAKTDFITDASWTPGVGTNGTLTLTFATGEAPLITTNAHVVWDNITNPNTVEDDFYLTVNTYNNTDCSTTGVDSSTVGFILTNGQVVTATVEGALACDIQAVTSGGTVNGATTNATTTDGTIPFGTVTTSTNKIAAHDINVSTNSTNGYTVYTRHTQLLTSGANTINNHTGTNAAPTSFSAAGTEGWGYTTNDSTLGTGVPARFTDVGNEWAAFITTSPGEEVAFNSTAVANQTTRVGYQVGISGTTETGTYTTDVLHTCVAVF